MCPLYQVFVLFAAHVTVTNRSYHHIMHFYANMSVTQTSQCSNIWGGNNTASYHVEEYYINHSTHYPYIQ